MQNVPGDCPDVRAGEVVCIGAPYTGGWLGTEFRFVSMNRLTRNNAKKIADNAAKPVSIAVSAVAIELVRVDVRIRGAWVEIVV